MIRHTVSSFGGKAILSIDDISNNFLRYGKMEVSKHGMSAPRPM